MTKIHDVQNLEFRANNMYLKVDDKDYIFPIEKISKRLFNASKMEREKFQISPSGYGIHWPLLDEDLSIDGLIGIKHAPVHKKKMFA
jgi:hypothetical protein